ncbi:hypothetical protein CLOM_g16122 [Closterium sp. NIES-68]|nr:hypothetical protein CLOM_g15022 [Closterium sp. NIES-68]GJP57084.1 hypothetical protein CLOM_g16122 [Closterium sp. NIES-68]GJP80858.1 hypothetical protein CLOP_g11057 [Closterium sp. NIES-67]
MAGTLSLRVPVAAAAVPAAGLSQPVAHSLSRAALVPLRARQASSLAAPQQARRGAAVAPRNVAMADSLTGVEEEGSARPSYPAGVHRYEAMVVLRPDLTDDERVALTERYEEFLVAGGALDVEIFNRGMQPLAYSIKTKNMGGVMSRYLDGIFFLFIFAARSDAQVNLQRRLNRDDDVIRSNTFRVKA